MKKIVLTVFLLLPMLLQAETLYVTDKIELGVHQSSEETSLLVNKIQTGMKLEVLNRDGNFVEIQPPQGLSGWVNEKFLTAEEPAINKLNTLEKKYNELTAKHEELEKKLKKKEREIQIRQDELLNTKSSIKELKKKIKELEEAKPDAPDTEALDAANKQIEELKNQIAQLEAAEPAAPIPDDSELMAQTKLLQDQVQVLEARVELAMASLTGEELPTEEMLAIIRPRFPMWYWGVLVVMIILGFVGGVTWIDYMHRRKHGGFRL